MATSVRELAEERGSQAVPVCARIEEELSELDEADRVEMLADYGMNEPALAKLTRATYKLLGLQSFYTAGEKEIRAWTVARGATAPEAAPTALGFLSMSQAKISHDIIAAAAAVLVTTKALVATPSAAKLLPALNPNHPNQSNAAPRTTMGTLAGPIGCSGNPILRPMIRAEAKAPAPALMCTTVPPAKSIAPQLKIRPAPSQTMWAIGK
jgi:hypothetical protein